MPAARGYDEDLAFIHDAGFADLARDAARHTLGLLAARGVSRGLVVELGCGSGVTARALLDAGHEVVAVDGSRAMLELARRRAPEARLVHASFLEAPIPRCDAVLAVGEALNYLFDPENGPGALAALFRRIHDALRPGGLLVLDLAGPGRVAGLGASRSWFAGPDWAVLVEAEEHPATRVLTRRMVSFRRRGEGYRRDEETHRQLLHRPADALALLRGAGLRARVRRGYGGEPFAPGHRVYVATRPR